MNLDNAMELKHQLLAEMYDVPQGNVGVRAEGLAVRDLPTDQLSIGYSRTGSSDYQLALRLKSRRGRAYNAAMRAKANAKAEVNLAFVESLRVPSEADLIQAAAGMVEKTSFCARKRPLHLGVSIGHGNGGPGTLGAFVETSEGKDAILSVCHVLAPVNNANLGDPIYQPGKESKQLLEGDVVATLTNSTAFSKKGSNYLDGAYATLKDGHDIEGNIVPEGCGEAAKKTITSVMEFNELLAHQTVAKIGRSSGYTTATVNSFGMDDVVIDIPNVGNTRFDNLLEISWDLEKPFAAEGDSGGLVFAADSFGAVGLHFASGILSVNGKRMGFSYSCSLKYLLEIFNLKLIS
jgi:hypothetical protein